MTEEKIMIEIDRNLLTEAVGSKALAEFLIEQAELFQKHFKQYRSDVISSSTSSAMQDHQRSGRRMGSRLPYGWKPDPDDPARMLPDKAELKAIKWMIKLRAEGLSYRVIIETLEGAGMFPRPNDDGSQKHWQVSTLRSILAREAKSSQPE